MQSPVKMGEGAAAGRLTGPIDVNYYSAMPEVQENGGHMRGAPCTGIN
jgi:hypothetical protein